MARPRAKENRVPAQVAEANLVVYGVTPKYRLRRRARIDGTVVLMAV